MTVNDIRPIKQRLRSEYKNIRKALSVSQKARLDEEIFRRAVNLWAYREEQLVLSYVSRDIEVDTVAIINKAFEDGKTVAVPRCKQGAGAMDFYIISSFDDLEKGVFGILEPNPEKCERLSDFSRGVCFVPALCFDMNGSRLGYGKGYYDRFLAKFSGKSVGLCYSSCICPELPCGKFDKSVDILISDKNYLIFGGETV